MHYFDQFLSVLAWSAQTRRAKTQPVTAIWLSVTSTDAPCSHLKRNRSSESVARLIAGISNCRTGMVEKASGKAKGVQGHAAEQERSGQYC
jgi:hypothetical protein